MKRFLVFMGSYYYPSGGWDDFVDSFATLEEAQAVIHERKRNGRVYESDWAHVVDATEGIVVYEAR